MRKFYIMGATGIAVCRRVRIKSMNTVEAIANYECGVSGDADRWGNAILMSHRDGYYHEIMLRYPIWTEFGYITALHELGHVRLFHCLADEYQSKSCKFHHSSVKIFCEVTAWLYVIQKGLLLTKMQYSYVHFRLGDELDSQRISDLKEKYTIVKKKKKS